MFLRRLLGLGLLLVAPLAARPATPRLVGAEGSLADYQLDIWTTEDGLPQNSVLSIAQTSDGYLWLATFNGLARFDGVRFTVYDAATTPELRSSRFVFLHADQRGGLWIISEFGELSHFADGRFTTFG